MTVSVANLNVPVQNANVVKANMNGAARARETPMISPECKACPAYSTGWCEYDFAIGQIMPHDPDACLITKEDANGYQTC